MSKSTENTFDFEYWKRAFSNNECEWISFAIRKIGVRFEEIDRTLSEVLDLHCVSQLKWIPTATALPVDLECRISVRAVTEDRLRLMEKKCLSQYDNFSDDITSVSWFDFKFSEDPVWRFLGNRISGSIEMEQLNYSQLKEISLNANKPILELLLPFFESIESHSLRIRRELSQLERFSYRQRHSNAFKLSGTLRVVQFD